MVIEQLIRKHSLAVFPGLGSFQEVHFIACLMRVIPKKKRRMTRSPVNGELAHGLRVESCLACPTVKEGIFSDLPVPVIAELEGISSVATFPKGSPLFIEGQEPRGVFVICAGIAKLSTTSGDGKSIIVRFAGPGEVVGLAATPSGKVHELTAEAREPLRASFVPREALLYFLGKHAEAAVHVAKLLSEIYNETLSEVRYLFFLSSSKEKLARFLLDLSCVPTQGNGHHRTLLGVIHKEIGDMLGSSRETNTRLFAHFRRIGLIEVNGASLTLKNKTGLHELLDS